MAVKLNVRQREEFLEKRKELKLTQLELSNTSRISLRTIQDLETGRRKSFSESTLIILCRTLDCSYDELIGGRTVRKEDTVSEQPAVQPKQRILIYSLGALVVISIVVISVLFASLKQHNRSSGEIDWVIEEQIPIEIEANSLRESEGIVVNYYKCNQVVKAGDSIEVELKWSYHYVPESIPEFYISAYGSWDPENEVRVFEGVLQGTNEIESLTREFTMKSPDTPGLYRIRVFFASAFAPVPRYHGTPPHSLVDKPSQSPYLEIIIEVLK